MRKSLNMQNSLQGKGNKTVSILVLCIVCAIGIYFLLRLLLNRDSDEQHMVNFNKPIIENEKEKEKENEQVTNWAHWEYHHHE
ncbi:MAG: hypothetical protein RDV48_26725 [Candidatus Eremiobacteraeota bacterium]|nr:hypothetical protein [Candidatus Eremiobacteraeota bacterium]